MYKLYLILRKDLLMYAVSALIMALVFWYNISPIAFNQYNTICTANYGYSSEYNRCMNPYWSQYGLDKAGMIISLGLGGIFMAIFIINKLSLKQRS